MKWCSTSLLQFGGFYMNKILKVGSISLISLLTFSSSAHAQGDDPGLYGSVITSNIARKASRALKSGAYSEAQNEFKKVLGKDDVFYIGFYEASRKLNQWDQAALALESLFEKRPTLKSQMNLEYGEVLFNLNRYSEAEPVLKAALEKVSEPSIVQNKLKTLHLKSDPPEAPPAPGRIIAHVPHAEPVLPPRQELLPTAVDENTTEALTYLNAFLKSESVLVAEFKSYETPDGPVTFNNPPTATYKIVQVLKGPPLNKTLPVRFEFHQKIRGSGERPSDWNWQPDSMPKVGSKWIIFIQNSVPVAGRFETFHGAFGRQEFTEKNIDEIHRIIQEHQGQAM